MKTAHIMNLLMNKFNYSCYFNSELLFPFLSSSAAQRGLWPSHPGGFLITHDDGPQSVGLLWMSDQLVAGTST
jgi:hypothetical protein